MLYNSKLLLVLTLLCTLFYSCAEEDVEQKIEEELDIELPTLSIQEIDYFRGVDTLEVDLGDYSSDIINIDDIYFTLDSKLLESTYANENGKHQVIFDSKQLADGMYNISATVKFSSDETLEGNEISKELMVDIDNFLPSIFVESGYSNSLDNKYENINGDWVARTETYDYLISYIVVDENLNPVSEFFTEDGSGINETIELPKSVKGQEFKLIKFESRMIESFAGFEGSEPLWDYIRDYRNIGIEEFPSQGEGIELNIFRRSGARLKSGEKTVVVAISKSFERHFGYSTAFDLSADDSYDYISSTRSELDITAISEAGLNSVRSYPVPITSGEKGIIVSLDMINDGDTVFIEESDLKESTKVNLSCENLRLAYEYQGIKIVGAELYFTGVESGDLKEYRIFDYINVDNSKLTYVSLKEIQGPIINSTRVNYSGFISEIKSLDESFKEPYKTDSFDYSVSDDEIILNPYAHDINKENVYNTIVYSLERPVEGKTEFYFGIGVSTERNHKLTLPKNLVLDGISEIQNGKFSDFFTNEITGFSLASSSSKNDLIGVFEINSYRVYAQFDNNGNPIVGESNNKNVVEYEAKQLASVQNEEQFINASYSLMQKHEHERKK
ncbi:hypothetical protein [Flammeovirga sp. EKP202]|uniref:hypothetical protein n=1 Tax=Flammeovirga sp. EKP202 TaxID=2770592 RepID=UPI00165FCAEC|nr:hypothetical protein [Flammeovirga sp. EKP202]MBD0399935.1 hypothetical protein [Flammeovirga sp. EKP202]